ncbi:uncharacterized protein FSUBG_7002 [Fusarium subglutinans]|uniref:Uncharacterized protein n=1 Tax=Gibberella subglutinans TaxID=42677 RepID=A0A8H5V0H0_GIBSU|nr:uncharacterized protein FSUBG_7002 [Fusarium subglutinans]KAF5603904.1 hypothetical protein FSUBG_7002 [Fusarium subglutinans]
MSQSSPETTKPTEPSHCRLDGGIEYKDLSPEQREVSDILGRMECDPYLSAYVHLGSDGVIRLIDAESNILHAEPLRPILIKGFLDRLPYDKEAERSFRGIDGTTVPKEQWYNPPEGVIPPPMQKEMRKEGQEAMEKYKEKFDKIRQDLESSIHEERLVYLSSDHKIY